MTTKSSKDMEDYKKNLTVLEKRLGEDCNDLATDLQGANSWLDDALRPDITEEKRKYYFQESFPKMLKSALVRKYDPTHKNFDNVLLFLERSIKTTADNMKEYPEGMSAALREVMDSSQPFYKKFCAMKETALINQLHPQQPQSQQNGAIADPTFISNIEVGHVVDFLNKNNQWMVGSVDRFSSFKTEIEVSTEEGANEWLTLENTAKIAPFGTKTGFTDVTPTVPDNAVSTHDASAASSQPQTVVPGDSAWKWGLTVGDLVDAKDKNNMWFQVCGSFCVLYSSLLTLIIKYQACVLGVKKVESATSTASAKYPVAAAAVAAVTDSLCDADLDSIYELSGPSSSSSVEMVVEEASTLVDQHDSDSASQSTMVVGELVDEDAVDPTATVFRSLVNIAFIGHPERSDEWICLEEAGDRIQSLNSFSFGRRGENPVRDEVQFLVNLKSPSQHAEIDSFALYREGCFVEPQLIHLVNVFGQNHGFDTVLRLMNEDSTTNVQALFAMITAVGHMHRVLSKSFLASFGPRFLDAASCLLSRMTLADMRETPVEILEQVFVALEQIAVAHYGRNAATGRILEPLKLEISLRNLSGPYLNRRLGGLRILSELVRRAEAVAECPHGLRTTVSTTNGVESTSYRVVPITYHFTIHGICSQLVASAALVGIFEGGNSHESLMARASGVLCAIATQNVLTESLLTAVWTAGFADRKAEALRVLSAVIPLLDPLSMAPIMGSVAQMQASAVTVSLVDITAAIAIRCRVFLFANEAQSLTSTQADRNHFDLVFKTYSDIIQLLWSWTEDRTSATEAVVARSLDKIEAVLDHGAAVLEAAKDEKFPWAMHWRRMQMLVETTLKCIGEGTSVPQALRVLQMSINAWPLKVPAESPVVQHLPFLYPTKQNFVNFLSSQYKVLDVLVGSVVRLKASLSRDVQTKALSSEELDAALKEQNDSGGRVGIPQVLQMAINELRVDGSRMKYVDQLDKVLQFIHTFMRYSDDIELPQSALVNIWRSVIYHPLTVEEVDKVATFCKSVIIRLAVSVGNLADLLTGGGDKAASAKSARRNTVTSKETAHWIFDNIINNTASEEAATFLRSPYFNRKVFECCEWWFRWANVEAGGLVEMQSDPKSSASTYMIIGAPHSLKGLELFPSIILTCESDLVAGLATKFFANLPQFLSPELKKNGETLIEFRKMFLERCVAELDEISRISLEKIDGSSARLSRVLLLLDGIIEESSVNSEHRIVPHGTLGKGNSVVFKLNASSKSLKHATGRTVTMTVFDSVHDLVLAVAKEVGVSLSDIKVFRRGHEISTTDYRKTIAAMQGGIDLGVESLMVTERPPHRIKSPCTSPSVSRSKQVMDLTGDMDTPPLPPHAISREVSIASQTSTHAVDEDKVSATAKIPLTAMPAWVLANNTDHFELLFNLLQSSSGADCDRIWKLVTRLPTSGAIMTQWLELDCKDVSELLMNFDSHSINNLCELLYKLQVVDVLLQPAASQEVFDKQQGGVGDVDHILLSSWAGRFVELGGFQALCQAHEWVEFALRSFLDSNGPVVGVTVNLLQVAVTLIAKLMRGFLIRISACTDEIKVRPILRTIKKKIDAANKPITVALPPVTTSTSLDSSTPVPPADSLEVKPIEEDCSALALAVVDAEWGWRIATDESHWAALHKAAKEVNIAGLQRTTLSTMTMLRRLSHHEYFASPKANSDSSTRTTLAARHEAALNVLGDLLVIWGCMGALDGDILLNIRRMDESLAEVAVVSSAVNCKALLSALLLGGYSVDVSDSQYVEESKLSTAIGDWFGASLLTMIQWSGAFTCTQDSALGIGSPSDALCSQVFLSLLDLRPSLVESMSSTADDTSANKLSTKKMNPLFTLASALLDSLTPATLAVIPAETRLRTCTVILEELRELSNRQRSDPNYKFVFHHLEGTVKLLAALPAGDVQILSTAFGRRTQDFLLTNCLGVVPIKQSQEPIVCVDDNSRCELIIYIHPRAYILHRKYIYNILYEACANNSTILRKLAATLYTSHLSVPPPLTWDYRPERDSRSATGFVGLKNLGSTCYMNSLLQVLFMNKHIRQYVLTSSLNLDQADDILKDDLALQLRKLFYSLQHSERKSFVPTDWTHAFKDETGCCPINVMQQQDAQEFLQLLCERFEKSIAAHNQTLTGSADLLVDVMHNTFGGKLCNQMFKATGSQTQEGSSESLSRAAKDIREQEESFVCISLEVKGSRGLECSLERFVEGEQINDYQWDDSSTERHTITKRQVISELGDTLVFHLKRFELNFDTFRREKVNDKFPFPLRLDMRPFTKEGLSTAEDVSQKGSEYYEYELGGVVVHTGTTDSGHYFAYIKDSAVDSGTEGAFSPVSSSSTTGGSDSTSSKWFEFNDSEVSVFDAEKRLEAECFGGTTTSGDFNTTTNAVSFSEVVNPKSAYMLVYNRVVKLNTSHASTPLTGAAMDLDVSQLDESDVVISNALRVLSSSEALVGDSSTRSFGIVEVSESDSSDLLLNMKQQVELENAQQALSLRVLNVNHMTFYKNIVESLYHSAALTNRPFYTDLLEQFFHFATKYLAHSSCVSLFSEVSTLLIKYFDSYQKTGFEVSNVGALSPKGPEVVESTSHSEGATVSPERERRHSSFSSPTPSAGPTVPPNQLILCEQLKDMDSVMGNLYAPREEVRKEFAALYLKLFKMTAEQEGPTTLSHAEEHGIDMRFGVITNAFAATTNVPANVPSSASKLHMIPESAGGDSDEDAELAMAIAMSTGSEGGTFAAPPTTPVKSVVRTVTLEDSAPRPDSYVALAPRFLWELTLDGRMQQIAEQWRKSASHMWLLLEISKHNTSSRDFLVRRAVATHIIDTILGDQSPLCGCVYVKGSRKRAPSSYVAVGVTKDGAVPLAGRNIPDWSLLLELLTHLVRGCYNPNNVPSLMQQKQSKQSVLDENGAQCVTVKTLYSTLLRQPRYSKHTIPLITHLCYGNKQFSDMICEVVLEEMNLCAIENTSHLFELLNAIVRVPDGQAANRASTLFGQGDLSLLEMMRGLKDNAAKTRYLCVLIKSFLSLTDGNAIVRDQVTRPISRLTPWAPWMLKFLFRFQTKCNNEARESSDMASNQAQINQAILASHAPSGAASAAPVIDSSASAPSAPPKGSYLVVYGESEGERESTWVTRAESTFQMIQRLLESVNANIDALMPEDTFLDPSAMQVDSSSDVITDPDLGVVGTGTVLGPLNYDDKGNVVSDLAAQGGAMTDEEFAAFLASGNMD